MSRHISEISRVAFQSRSFSALFGAHQSQATSPALLSVKTEHNNDLSLATPSPVRISFPEASLKALTSSSTEVPCPSNSTTVCEPMNPAPPVTVPRFEIVLNFKVKKGPKKCREGEQSTRETI